ncbi:disproportionating enzyme [Actinidia rufa]|uniref:4-alpha-glucanotransferase n=1 Tax=Actinidia rufa TaxID=165716 RepID=A0A7J0EMA8_9ERIC|nr:disproportionating enzyme [Actinidia rufa]
MSFDHWLTKAAERLILSEGELKRQLEEFRKDPDVASWLEDAAYFAAIDNYLDTFSWYDWPAPLKNRHLAPLEEIYQSKKDFINIFISQQFLFQRQWQKVRDYARVKGISIMGDMPIYVGYHSADVWANKKQFLLNRSGFPLLVSGVPPDAFSETGQLWDSPLYDWKAMEEDGFSWWIRRIRRAENLFDEFRIDHFRGFAGFWAVPSEAKIAMVGRWKVKYFNPRFHHILLDYPNKSTPDDFLLTVTDCDLGNEAFLNKWLWRFAIKNDYFWRGVVISKYRLKAGKWTSKEGVITADVVQLRNAIGAPGMAVLQFGFGSDADNPHLPHNHECNQVVYTGTHDNDTVLKYLSITEENIPGALIQAALSSVAQTAIIPMQDILRLGSSARMNIPATQFGNWSWRIPSSMSFDSLDNEAKKLRDMLSMYGRL